MGQHMIKTASILAGLSLLPSLALVGTGHADEWPTTDWQSVSPEQAAVSADALKALDDYAFDAAYKDPETGKEIVRTDGLLVVKGGKIVYERYARGYDKDRRHLSWSMAKSFTNAMAGRLVMEGKIDIDDPVRKTTDWPDTPGLDDGLTWRHLLTMSSGIQWEETYELAPLKSTVVAMLYTRGRNDMARFVASQPREFEPGFHWEYSSGDSTLMQGLMKDVIGPDAYAEYPWTSLFDKIGIRSAIWEADQAGTYVGSSYLYMTPRDYAKFGYLFLKDGVWDQERLLPEGWVDWSCKVNPSFLETFARGTALDAQPYGAQMWLNAQDAAIGLEKFYKDAPENVCMALGHWRQMIAVLPDQDMVIVRVAHDRGLSGDVTNNDIIKLALKAFK